ncbi:MAG TPA: tripartite tricarboxylate transporter substrate binding protein [Burkholderiales bacterium]|jgi:tripartite-type tricarboxylate transporter receptor subunit TctC|nr:tripartite tricarboxylate transporter substrate binding protein [Burkholderiales bacterium]
MRAVQVVAAFIAGMLCAAGVAWSQAYPAKPVRVLIPFPPGGANDIMARIVFPKLSEQMGQQFIIENRSGAGGTVGSALVAQSKPDGYTLLIQTVASHCSNPHLYKKLPYDALNDFVGVSPLGNLVTVLTVHPSLPVRSVKEFVALAKKRPKEIMFGHAGYGSFIHLNTVILESATGIQVTQVPFKGGGPTVIGLVSGEIHGMTAGIGDILEHIKSGRARALGVSSLERMKKLPDVPTIAETFPGYESSTWVSVFAPAGLPKAILDRLHAEIGTALRDPTVASRMSDLTFDPVHKSPEELARRMKTDYDKIGKLFRQYNVSLD